MSGNLPDGGLLIYLCGQLPHRNTQKTEQCDETIAEHILSTAGRP